MQLRAVATRDEPPPQRPAAAGRDGEEYASGKAAPPEGGPSAWGSVKSPRSPASVASGGGGAPHFARGAHAGAGGGAGQHHAGGAAGAGAGAQQPKGATAGTALSWRIPRGTIF